ncbi:4-amino-4-deoxy-L-arabinose transferase-like glycosyltransferase [Nocardia transvalensis]|uniref:4-amino-4-deoxy-L-arabinose transferase-like glycosyltransferase n=1 Tax=Nocardia transvalensis TaxID=37333 RepID=A0A7W9PLA6_9NOCA|nr:glycosyltransferase family 39 protein [Nocardia transvalensis]MBB5918279.1 4-amino-4-deoxy-L-arabinose transferase-like glycosyltransferase [Nocardia transvalensis]
MPAFAARGVLAVAAVTAVAHLAVAAGRGYWFDEAYMLAIGRHHLAWGSADQPPLAPALAAALDWLAPGSILALRLPAVLATAGAVVVVALVARELGGDRRAQILAAAAQATALWVTMSGHWLTPYTLEPVEWLLILWLLVRWIRVRDDRLLLALGAVAGIAAETKFQVLLLCAVLLAAVAVFGPRELLRRPMLWAGAGLGLLIALPTLVWQARNGWPQLRMGSVVAAEADALYGGRPGVAIALIVMAGVAGTALSLYGLWRLLRADELRAYRFLGVSAVVLYVFFVATVGRPYYLNGLYGLLFAAGAAGLQGRRLAGGRRGWFAWPLYALSVAAAAGMLAIAYQSTAVDSAQRIQQRAAAAYRELPTAERDSTAVMGESYIVAAYLDVYSRPGELPPAYSTNRSYGYFPPPPESARDVLYIGEDPDELRDHFTECHAVARTDEEQQPWLCTGRRESWQDLWPRLRHLDVG